MKKPSLVIIILFVLFAPIILIIVYSLGSDLYKLMTGKARFGFDACVGPGEVVSEYAPAIQQQFKIREVYYGCEGVFITQIERESADVIITSDKMFTSSAELSTAVVGLLQANGWKSTSKSNTLEVDFEGSKYETVVEVNSYQPAMAKLLINKRTNISYEPSLVHNVYPPLKMPDKELIPYATFTIYNPVLVPAGYAQWGDMEVRLDKSIAYTDLHPKIDNSPKPTLMSVRASTQQDGSLGCKFTADGKPSGCIPFGTTSNGRLIYTDAPPQEPSRLMMFIDNQNADDMVLILSGAYNHPNLETPITKDDLIGIFNSATQLNMPARK